MSRIIKIASILLLCVIVAICYPYFYLLSDIANAQFLRIADSIDIAESATLPVLVLASALIIMLVFILSVCFVPTFADKAKLLYKTGIFTLSLMIMSVAVVGIRKAIDFLDLYTLPEIATKVISWLLGFIIEIRSNLISPVIVAVILISILVAMLFLSSTLRAKLKKYFNKKAFIILFTLGLLIYYIPHSQTTSTGFASWTFSLMISWILSFIIGIKSLTCGNVLLVYIVTKSSAISLTSLFSGFIFMSIFLSVMFLIPNLHSRVKKATTSVIFLLLLTITASGYPAFYPLPQMTAKSVSLALNYTIGVMPLTYENTLFLNMGDTLTMVFISPECSGFILMSVFVIVTFLLPNIKTGHRIASLLLLPLIYLANVFRIFISVIIGIYTNVNIMTFVHDTIGQVFLLVFTLALFVAYLSKLNYLKLKRLL